MKPTSRLLVIVSLLVTQLFSTVKAEMTDQEIRDEIQTEVQKQIRASAPTTIDQKKIDFTSGNGLPLINSPYGDMKLTIYMMMRYINQLPATQTFEDHLGRTRT